MKANSNYENLLIKSGAYSKLNLSLNFIKNNFFLINLIAFPIIVCAGLYCFNWNDIFAPSAEIASTAKTIITRQDKKLIKEFQPKWVQINEAAEIELRYLLAILEQSRQFSSSNIDLHQYMSYVNRCNEIIYGIPTDSLLPKELTNVKICYPTYEVPLLAQEKVAFAELQLYYTEEYNKLLLRTQA